MLFHNTTGGGSAPIKVEGAFNLKLALIVTLTMTGITLLSSATLSHFSQVGVMLTATFTGFADPHYSTASIASLTKAGLLPFSAIATPMVIAISSYSISKCLVAWVSGGRRFAAYVIPGLILLTLSLWVGVRVH